MTVMTRFLIRHPGRVSATVGIKGFSPFVFQLVTYTPFTLFPTPVPRAAYLQAMAVQTHFNMLVDRISQDVEFLQEALAR